jgi:acylphosphatase
MNKRLKVKITGVVQGVNFRYEAEQMAESLGIKGWVRNIPTDAVEAVFEGEEDELKKMLEWCWEGPDVAQVRDIEEQWANPKDKYDDFSIRL